MSVFDKHLTKWWERRSDEQRATLKSAAEDNRMDTETRTLLIDTQCPVGPVGTRWENPPEGWTDYAWSWPNDVREFIKAQ